MYLRGLWHRSNNLAAQPRTWRSAHLRGGERAVHAKRYSSFPPKSERTARLNERHKQAGGRSVRPFTVLALCIPLGYGVSWSVGSRAGNPDATSPDGFVKYTLTRKEEASPTCAIFTLKPVTPTIRESIRGTHDNTQIAIKSVQVKQPQLQIARNYTLLPPLDGEPSEELSFLIRKEPRGEVSGYLHRLPVGAEIELRGPVVDYVLPRDVDTIVFLAGGTGIAPAMQVADSLGRDSNMHILWASKRSEDCAGGTSDDPQTKGWMSRVSIWPVLRFWQTQASTVGETANSRESLVVSRLNYLKHSQNGAAESDGPTLLVDYFVDEEGTFISGGHIRQLLKEADEATSRRQTSSKLLFISGPEGFVSYWAGPKQWLNGREVQGPLGGVLSTLELAGWEVVKL